MTDWMTFIFYNKVEAIKTLLDPIRDQCKLVSRVLWLFLNVMGTVHIAVRECAEKQAPDGA